MKGEKDNLIKLKRNNFIRILLIKTKFLIKFDLFVVRKKEYNVIYLK